MNNYTYTYACRNIFNTIKTSGHSSLEKTYLSLYLQGFERFTKGIICERWVGDWTELQHIDPNSSGHSRISFPFSGAAQPGAWGPSLCWDIFSPNDLKFLSPGLYNNLKLTYFQRASQFRTQFNPSTVKVAPDLLISSTGCTCYLHRCISSFDSLAGSEVNIPQ